MLFRCRKTAFGGKFSTFRQEMDCPCVTKIFGLVSFCLFNVGGSPVSTQKKLKIAHFIGELPVFPTRLPSAFFRPARRGRRGCGGAMS